MFPENEPSGAEDFDAEINAILNPESDAPAAQPPAAKGGQTAPTGEAPKLKFGGRDWQSVEDLGKAYESLNKDYTKKGQALKEGEKWINWGKAVAQHEELRADIEKRIADFQARQSQQALEPRRLDEATRAAQERLDRVEAFVAKQEVDAEIKGLKAKYKLSNEDVKLVVEKAANLLNRKIDLPLEDVYRIVAFDRQAIAAKQEGEQGALERLKRSKAANVGGSSPAGVNPAAKNVNEMTKEEYDRALEDELKQFGVTG